MRPCKDKYRRSLLFGMVYMPVGLIAGSYLQFISVTDRLSLVLSATIAAWMVPAWMWWILLDRQNRHTLGRAITAGVFGAALTHYVCGYLYLLVLNFQFWILDIQTSNHGEPPMNPLLGLLAMWMYAAISWQVIGWITITAGAVLGAVFFYFIRKREAV